MTPHVVGELGVVEVRERFAFALAHPVAAGQVVDAEHHVLRRRDDRLAVRGLEQVVDASICSRASFLRGCRQRHVDSHLVAVEVGVEGRADQRVDLDGGAFDQHRLESLDAEAVQRRRAVEQHRVVLDDLFEHVPHFGPNALDDALGALDVVR